METSGVPLLPGYHGDRQDADFLEDQAMRIGFPVVIKAVSGGGGRGMRVVTAAYRYPTVSTGQTSCWKFAHGSTHGGVNSSGGPQPK